MTAIIIVSVATNVYLFKKLANKANERNEIAFAKEQLRRNRKTLMKQYLEIGTISERR